VLPLYLVNEQEGRRRPVEPCDGAWGKNYGAMTLAAGKDRDDAAPLAAGKGHNGGGKRPQRRRGKNPVLVPKRVLH